MLLFIINIISFYILQLETELIQTAQKSDCYSYDETTKCDFQTPSEYIDIIKRSSENVYARTEALASKKTSFKVMKRLQYLHTKIEQNTIVVVIVNIRTHQIQKMFTACYIEKIRSI